MKRVITYNNRHRVKRIDTAKEFVLNNYFQKFSEHIIIQIGNKWYKAEYEPGHYTIGDEVQGQGSIIDYYITPDKTVSAGQMLDTGITPTMNISMEIYFKYDTSNANMYGDGNANVGICAQFNKGISDSADFRFFATSQSRPYFYCDIRNGRRYYQVSSSQPEGIYKAVCSRSEYTLTNITTNQSYTPTISQNPSSGDYTWTGYTIEIEHKNTNGAYLRYYMIRFYDSGTLIREYVPKEKPDFGWCFYDNVNQEYLYSENGPWVKTDTPDFYVGNITPPEGRVMKVDSEIVYNGNVYERLVNIRDESDVLRGNFIREWTPENYNIKNAPFGSILMAEVATNKLFYIQESEYNSTDYPLNGFKPIGVCIYDKESNANNETIFMSSQWLDYNSLGTGSPSNILMAWGFYNVNMSTRISGIRNTGSNHISSKTINTAVKPYVTVDYSGTSISNTSGDGAAPAFCCCWRFSTIGTSEGEWYLPSYYDVSKYKNNYSTINNVLSTIVSVAGNSYLNVNKHDMTVASEYSNANNYNLSQAGSFYNYYKSGNTGVRAVYVVGS